VPESYFRIFFNSSYNEWTDLTTSFSVWISLEIQVNVGFNGHKAKVKVTAEKRGSAQVCVPLGNSLFILIVTVTLNSWLFEIWLKSIVNR